MMDGAPRSQGYLRLRPFAELPEGGGGPLETSSLSVKAMMNGPPYGTYESPMVFDWESAESADFRRPPCGKTL